MLHELEGKVAVVTGAGSGIGAALCRGFADAGMRVVVADIDATRAQAVASISVWNSFQFAQASWK